jgi:multiple sugar transport system permease protein
MRAPSLRAVTTEAKLLLIGIPVVIWTLLPIYHLFLFAISPKQDAFAGSSGPTIRPCATSRSSSARSTTS